MIKTFHRTLTALIAISLLTACGIRSAPTFDHAANGVVPYRYAPLYSPGDVAP